MQHADADADPSLSPFPLDWTAWYGTRLEGWMRRIPRAEGGSRELAGQANFRVVKHFMEREGLTGIGDDASFCFVKHLWTRTSGAGI
jgi:hypothetical protein